MPRTNPYQLSNNSSIPWRSADTDAELSKSKSGKTHGNGSVGRCPDNARNDLNNHTQKRSNHQSSTARWPNETRCSDQKTSIARNDSARYPPGWNGQLGKDPAKESPRPREPNVAYRLTLELDPLVIPTVRARAKSWTLWTKEQKRAILELALKTPLLRGIDATEIFIRDQVHPTTHFYGERVPDRWHISVAVKDNKCADNMHMSAHGYTIDKWSNVCTDTTIDKPKADNTLNRGKNHIWPQHGLMIVSTELYPDYEALRERVITDSMKLQGMEIPNAGKRVQSTKTQSAIRSTAVGTAAKVEEISQMLATSTVNDYSTPAPNATWASLLKKPTKTNKAK